MARRMSLSLVAAAVVTACAPTAGTGSVGETTAASSATSTGAFESEPVPGGLVDIEGAIALRVSAGPEGSAWVAWTDAVGISVAALALEDATLGSPIKMSGAEGVMAHPIERPALASAPDGTLYVAWISGLEDVRLATLDSTGHASEARGVSGEPRHETVLVHMVLTDRGTPVLSWLEDSSLSVAFADAEGGVIEHERVDQRTCDCCHPVPIQIGDEIGIGYRDAATIDGRTVRDVAFLTGGIDGQAFAPPSTIADDHWFLEGCPFSGPAVTSGDVGIVVAWMDGRQNMFPDQDATAIWVDRSPDGITFGKDLRVTTDNAIHRNPSLATDAEGTIHLLWERRTPQGASLEYARSGDSGGSFADSISLVGDDDGAPREASIAVIGGRLAVAWADNAGGHVGVWDLS
jgi:hypothetical protein